MAQIKLESRARFLTINLVDILPLLKAQDLVVDHQVPDNLSESRAGVLQVDLASVRPGDIFMGYAGSGFDGNQNVPSAIVRRCSFVVCEDKQTLPNPSPVPWIQVREGRRAWAYLCAVAAGSPQRRLALGAVTGTNGKTSVAWIVRALLNRMGRDCLSIGTLGAYFNRQRLPLKNTTPGPDTIFPLLANAVQAEYKYGVLEVSSHALDQARVSPIAFAVCALTSFSRDHLDYHRTMDEYWEAKWRLFTDNLAPDGIALLHHSVATRMRPLRHATQRVWLYGHDLPPSTLQGIALELLEARIDGSRIRFTLPDTHQPLEGTIPYVGVHNAENFLVACAMVHEMTGLTPDPALWPGLDPIPGRLESVRCDSARDSLGDEESSPTVLVDYAHTPDGLAKVLDTARSFCRGRLWVVFGCGGDRDHGKRGEMARVAQAGADMVVVTTDNPRSESPQAIVSDILRGFKPPLTRIVLELDRAKAIALAVRRAHSDDVVVIAGKGHETTQIVGDREVEFDDRLTAQRILTTL